MSKTHRQLYEKELASWIEKGWLMPYSTDLHGSIGGVLPFIAVL